MGEGSSIDLSYCQLDGDFKGIEANSENIISIKNSNLSNTDNLIDAVNPVTVTIDSCIFEGSSISGITLAYPESVWINGNQFIDNGLYALCIISPLRYCAVKDNQISGPDEYGIKYYGARTNALFSGNEIIGKAKSDDNPITGIYVAPDLKEGDPLVTIEGGNINYFDIGIQLIHSVEGTLVGPGVHSDSNFKDGIDFDKAYGDLLGTGDPGGANTFNYNGYDGINATGSEGTIRKSHFDNCGYSGGEVYDCSFFFGDTINEGYNSIGDGSIHSLLAIGTPIMAQMNWWGTADEGEIKDKVTELVTYEPFLMSPLLFKRNLHHEVVPTEFNLSQTYPNPFNSQAKIEYTIPENSHISIKIYNILGQEINELINQDVEPGYYSIIWNGNDKSGNPISSGVYLYCLRTPDKVITKKMVMLK